jgi:hypothetical protein
VQRWLCRAWTAVTVLIDNSRLTNILRELLEVLLACVYANSSPCAHLCAACCQGGLHSRKLLLSSPQLSRLLITYLQGHSSCREPRRGCGAAVSCSV